MSTPVLKMMKMKVSGVCTRQASKVNSYILWYIALLMILILSNPVNQRNLNKYWPHACKPPWTHGKAYYGIQEEHWSQKSHVGTVFDSAGRMDSGPMFQTKTHQHLYQLVIMQAIEWNLNVWR
jgi:hypothetical protein